MQKPRFGLMLSQFMMTACGAALCPPLCLAQVHVLVDQVGYETAAQKQAIISASTQDHPH